MVQQVSAVRVDSMALAFPEAPGVTLTKEGSLARQAR